jgi:hypothetical protein
VGGRSVLFHTTTYTAIPADSTPPDRGDVPQFVVVLSDQGTAVRFPVGAVFGGNPSDFRVEAHYPDGFTRLVTKKATIHTADSPDKAIVTASNGKLIGVRPGSLELTPEFAEFDGVHSTPPDSQADFLKPANLIGKLLKTIEVSEGVDIDKLAVEPADGVTILPGENAPLRAVGYKAGKSIGDITNLGNLQWKSTNEQVASVNGASVHGASLGQASVTVSNGTITSAPTPVSVTNSISGNLKVDPKTIVLHVNESQRLGSDITVSRADMDVSSMANVVPQLPGIVRYDPVSRTLTGLRTGRVPVAFTLGDKVRTVDVEVQGFVDAAGGSAGGSVVIEPGSITLAPGQCDRIRVFIVTAEGDRVDRTSTAVFKVIDPGVAKMMGDRVCATAPGTTSVMALVGGLKAAKASLTVNNEQISGVQVDPKQIDMNVGDSTHINIFGDAPCGLKELYPQPDLNVSTGKQGVINVVGTDEVHGMAIGDDTINVTYKGKSPQQIAVRVANNPFTDLRIEPAQETIPVGASVAYQVSAMRGGERRILTPQDGVQILVSDPNVGSVVGNTTAVAGRSPGRTSVVAQLGTAKVEAALEVQPAGAAGLGTVVAGDPFIVASGDPIVGANGVVERVVVGDDGVAVVRDRVMAGIAGVVTGTGVGLRFEPASLNMGVGVPPQTIRVYEKLDNGLDGRDVTNDPNLVISDPNAEVATLVKNPGETPSIKPVAVGTTKITATLGNLTTAEPMWINIGGEGVMTSAGGATLVVGQNSLVLWPGETRPLGPVRLNSGNEDITVPVEYKLTAPAGQGIVTVDADNTIHAGSPGSTQLTVTATDPKYQGLATVVPVQVVPADTLSFAKDTFDLQVGEHTDLIAVNAKSQDGAVIAVPAQIASMDPSVIDGDPSVPGTFVAKAMGQTKLQATYRGVTCVATVSVTGQRFVTVNTALANKNGNEFDANIEVLAAGAEGEIEYRVYKQGEAPQENWVPNQPEGNNRKVVLISPKLTIGGEGTMYHLVLEARKKGEASPAPYPLTLQLKSTLTIEQIGQPKDSTQPKDMK